MPYPARGSNVILTEKPDGCLSQHYPVTVGNVYTVLDWWGSNLLVTSDEPGRSVDINWQRFKPVEGTLLSVV